MSQWGNLVTEPALGAFQQWAMQFRGLPETAKAATFAQGLALAQ